MDYSKNIKLLLIPMSVILCCILLGLIVNKLIFRIAKKHLEKYPYHSLKILTESLEGPFYLIFPLIFLNFAASIFDFKDTAFIVSTIVNILVVTAISWSAIKMLDSLDVWMTLRWLNLSYEDQQKSQTLRTKFYVIKRILKGIILAIMIAIILLNFDQVKQLGKGILISAGFMGATIIFAAQQIFSNMFAGLQLIYNKPIKIGDLISLENETGNVEEITLSYVTIRTGEQKLIVFPLNYFLQKCYTNLSYPTPNLTGYVYFYADYNINVEKLRAAYLEMLTANPLWDKNEKSLQVAEMKEHCIQLRGSLSARNAADLWNLQCDMREKIINFMQNRCPQSLPKVHTLLTSNDAVSTKNIVNV